LVSTLILLVPHLANQLGKQQQVIQQQQLFEIEHIIEEFMLKMLWEIIDLGLLVEVLLLILLHQQ